MKTFSTLALCSFSVLTAIAQQPAYTPKHFVREQSKTDFKVSGQTKNGVIKTFVETTVSYYDVDDKGTTHIRGTSPVLLNIESEVRNGKRNGSTKQYLIDSADHSKRFLIAEQTYANDKLNGSWTTYNLKGTRVRVENFKDDSLNGISTHYWIDGKTVMGENEFFNGRSKFIAREFFDNGKIKTETTIVNGEPEGEVKEYYDSGILKDKFSVKNGGREGLRIYYYPDGKPWIETIYKGNKPWTLIANYDSKGKKRDGGTLKDGNGTMIYYDDDTTARETVRYVNGEPQ